MTTNDSAFRAARRRTFHASLRQVVESSGTGFVQADLARVNGVPVWHVTINRPATGIAILKCEFPPGAEPYGDETLDELGKYITNAIR